MIEFQNIKSIIIKTLNKVRFFLFKIRNNFLINSKIIPARYPHSSIEAKLEFFIVLGIQRSGNHLIIDWLCRGIKHPIHFNNMYLNKKSRLVPMEVKHYSFDNKDMSWDSSLSLKSNFKQLDPSKVLLIYSFENINIHSWSISYPNAILKLIVLRDPANFLASLMKMNGERKRNYKRLMKIYKEYLRISNSTEIKSFLFINYNEFIINENYRKSISKKIKNHNFQKADEALNHIPKFGGGSSFSGVTGEISPETQFTRWKNYMHNQKYLSLLKDPELKILSKSFFGNNLPGYLELGL